MYDSDISHYVFSTVSTSYKLSGFRQHRKYQVYPASPRLTQLGFVLLYINHNQYNLPRVMSVKKPATYSAHIIGQYKYLECEQETRKYTCCNTDAYDSFANLTTR